VESSACIVAEILSATQLPAANNGPEGLGYGQIKGLKLYPQWRKQYGATRLTQAAKT
jgi:hypothetical protein